MSVFARIWSAIRKPLRLAGRDLEGNRYYETPSPFKHSRTRRTVQYHDPEAMWDYVGGRRRLPVQWSAWLTHTRRQPPSLEELHTDLARQQRVRMNAAMIEARDLEEKNSVLQSSANAAAAIEMPKREATQGQSQAPNISEGPPLPKVQTDNWEPQSWMPQSRRKGTPLCPVLFDYGWRLNMAMAPRQ